jgi:hypothetical protein
MGQNIAIQNVMQDLLNIFSSRCLCSVFLAFTSKGRSGYTLRTLITALTGERDTVEAKPEDKRIGMLLCGLRIEGVEWGDDYGSARGFHRSKKKI